MWKRTEWHISLSTSHQWWLEPERGTRPGNALADAVFALSFTRPLEAIAEYIRTNDLALDSQPRVCVFSELDDEPQPTTDVAYADDGLLMAVLRSNKAIARQAERLCDVVHVALTTAGYKPNYKRGKSGLMASVAGPNPRDTRRALYT